jgi:hypothetical protein
MSSQPRSPRDKEDARREGAATRETGASSEGAAIARPRRSGPAPKAPSSALKKSAPPRSRSVTPKPPSVRTRAASKADPPRAATPIPTRSRKLPPVKEAAKANEVAVPAKVKPARRTGRTARARDEMGPLEPRAHEQVSDAQRLPELAALSARADLLTIPREFRNAAPGEPALADFGAPPSRYLAIAVGVAVVAFVGAIGWFAAGPSDRESALPATPVSPSAHAEAPAAPSSAAPALVAPSPPSPAPEPSATPSKASEVDTAPTPVASAGAFPSAASAPGTVSSNRPSTPAPVPSAATSSAALSAIVGPSGFLNINSLPASDVILDGDPVGSTPLMHVRVAAGPHTVVFKNADLGVMKGISVTVGEGETKVASARLRE